MKPIKMAAVAAWALTAPAAAQTPIKPGTPSILFWKGDQQATGFRTIEKIYKVYVIGRGTKVHPLPLAGHQIGPTFEFDGKTWSVDDYMKRYRVSGLLVLKDGKIVMER